MTTDFGHPIEAQRALTPNTPVPSRQVSRQGCRSSNLPAASRSGQWMLVLGEITVLTDEHEEGVKSLGPRGDVV